LGDYVLTSGVDFDVTTGTDYVDEDITNTAPDGVIVIWKTAGAGMGEGTIDVPANVPIEESSVTIKWTSGAAEKTQTDDGAGGFAGDGTPGSSTIDYETGAITLDTTGDIPDGASSITISYTADITEGDVASNLSDAIDDLPGYSAAPAAAVVTVTGPTGPVGNDALFLVGGVSPYLFTLSPDTGALSGAEPYIGPVSIT